MADWCEWGCDERIRTLEAENARLTSALLRIKRLAKEAVPLKARHIAREALAYEASGPKQTTSPKGGRRDRD